MGLADKMIDGAYGTSTGCLLLAPGSTRHRPFTITERARLRRSAYELRIGPVPPGRIVSAVCSPWCINPEHLRLVPTTEVEQ